MSNANRENLEAGIAGAILHHRDTFGLEADEVESSDLQRLLRGIAETPADDFKNLPLDGIYRRAECTDDEIEHFEIQRLQPSAAIRERAESEVRLLREIAKKERTQGLLSKALDVGDHDRARSILGSAPKTDTPKPPTVRRWRPFPLATLPECVRGFVGNKASTIGVDPAMVVMGALAAAAGAIGNALAVVVPGRDPEPVALWIGIVAKSGAGKSPALACALEPLHRVERERHEEAKRANKGVADPAMRVSPQRMILDDVTPECIFGILGDNPRGLISTPDELAGFLAGLGRYGAGVAAKTGDAAQYCRLYDGRQMRYDRKAGKQSVFLASPLCTIIGGIPPDTLRLLATKDLESQGLIPRLALIAPPTKPAYFNTSAGDQLCSTRYRAAIRDLCALPCECVAGELQRRILRPTGDALGLWIAYHDKLTDQAHAAEGVKASTISKSKHFVLRIAVILHALQTVGRVAEKLTDAADLDRIPTTDEHRIPELIDIYTMRRAIELSRWMLRERLRVLDLIATDADTFKLHDLANSINWIKYPEGITPNELYKDRKTTFASGEAAELQLKKCVGLGLLVERFGTRGSQDCGGRETLIFSPTESCASGSLGKADEVEGYGVSSDDEETEGNNGDE